ncbi:hypothetical protein PGT21_004456 [Puccinia graminis f. sp. tritici]|uniref:Uncharacterized protein n=1 Tax=Puccinia graminis f. sp. tritici TaxID=56615 RepID=A0A5B0NFK3_PUCGR|nr:hypothetical protein PGT21_004456 [Puccinia graminis f. sp. tritici]
MLLSLIPSLPIFSCIIPIPAAQFKIWHGPDKKHHDVVYSCTRCYLADGQSGRRRSK